MYAITRLHIDIETLLLVLEQVDKTWHIHVMESQLQGDTH